MKKLVVVLGAALSLLVLAGCLESGGPGSGSQQGPLFRYHFAGRSAVGKDGSATILTQIGALKESADLRTHFSQRLAIASFRLWTKELPGATHPSPALLQAIYDDLLSAESLVEVRGPVGRIETLVAAELSEQRSQLWETNLVQLAAAWKLGAPTAVNVAGGKSWAVRRSQAPNVFQFVRAGKWTLIGLGQDKLNLLPAALQQIASTGRPAPALSTAFLDLQADLPGLRPWSPLLTQFPLPPVHLTMAGRGENVRTEMRLRYAGRIPFKFEPWQIPTNTIGEPLTSFTVAQGIRPFLERVGGLKTLELSSLPNQFTAWGIFNPQARAYFAVPRPGVTAEFPAIAANFPKFVNHYFPNTNAGILYFSNRSEVVWSGVPFVSPHMRAVTDGQREFLLGGIFPLPPKTVPVPAELFAQLLGRTNLLYYDWELSSNRVEHARQIHQLANIGAQRPPISVETPSQRWISAAGPRLGNAVTEITQTAPHELLMVRKSQVGLTGFEIATLSAWLESPGFPQRIEMPPAARPAVRRGTNAPAGKPATPGTLRTSPAAPAKSPAATPNPR